MDNRSHLRVPCVVKVAYEFTSWKDQDLSEIHNPINTEAADISLVGIGIPHMVQINHSLEKKLIEGKKKVKMALSLYEGEPPLIFFARLVWVDLKKDIKEHSHRGGLKFLDISTVSYFKIKKYVDDKIKEMEL